MRESLELLIELQEIDSQLQSLESSKGDLPQTIEASKNEIQENQDRLEDKQQEKIEKDHRRHTIDNDLILLKEKLKKYQAQLYQVKTNREYDAITLETESTQKNIDDLEFEFLMIEDSLQEIDKEITAIAAEIERLKETLKENEQVLDNVIVKNQAKEQQLSTAREKRVIALSKPVLSTYERIRKARDGVAMALLQNGACSECSSRIPPQRGLEIRMMDKVHFCEVCGRILVWLPVIVGDGEKSNS